MNEGEFDKIISKKLKEEGADYPNKDANWQKIKDKMAQLQEPKPTAGGVVVLPNQAKGFGQNKGLLAALLSGLLLLLGANGWLLWRLTQSTTQTPLTSEQQKVGQTTRLYDTIIETKVIYQIDTIYKKVIIIQPISVESNPNLGLIESKRDPSVKEAKSTPFPTVSGFHSSTESYDKLSDATQTQNLTDKNAMQNAFDAPKKGKIKEENPLNNASNHSNTVEKSKERTNNQASALPNKQEVIEKTPNGIAEKQTMNTPSTNRQDTKFLLDSIQNKVVVQTDSLDNDLKLASADSLKYAKVPFDSLELKPTTESIQNIINALPKKIVVDHYALGIQSGASWFIPSKSGVNAPIWYGVQGEIAFKKGLHIALSLDNAQNQFKVITREEVLNLPNDPPMTENYNLKYIEGSLSSVQAGIGLSYLFQSEKSIKPLLSLGYSRRWVLPYTSEFEFTNKLTGEERSFQVKNTEYHQDNWFMMGFGAETAISSRFLLRLKADYIIDPNHRGQSIKQFLLRGGIFYKF